MRTFLVVAALALSLTAFAQDESVESHTTLMNGYGNAYGMCDGSGMSWYCMDQVKKQAENNAASDAERQCSLQNGRIDYYSAVCNDLCNPMDLPIGAPMQNVSCSANCNLSCSLPN